MKRKEIFLTLIALFLMSSLAYGKATQQSGFSEIYTSKVGPLSIFSHQREFRHDGVHFEYFSNGEVKIMSTYKQGALNGFSTGYYENGQVLFEHYFEKGKLVGPQMLYHSNGSLHAELNYKDDEPHGIAKIYSRRGTLEKETLYENGIVMQTKHYDEKGNIKKIKHF